MPAAVLVAIVLMTAATIAAAALVLAPRLEPGRLVFDQRPDRPPPFGYRMAWLAIRTRDTAGVVDALGLSETAMANWSTGLGTVYDKVQGEAHVFVAPPVNGWTFVVGLPLPHPLGRGFADKATPFLLGLGQRFVEVQYFFSYPEIEYTAWARIIDGKLLRAFAISDEGNPWNVGKPTKEERGLGLRLFEPRAAKGRRSDSTAYGEPLPTELHLMQLAGKWSIDPTRVDRIATEPATGRVGRALPSWRAERLKKAA